MTDTPDILVLAPLRPEKMTALEAAYSLHRHDRAADPDAMLAEIGPRIRAVVTGGGAGFKAEMLEKLPALEIVASNGVGYDSIDVAACAARGVPVTNTPDVLTDDVADLAMALILMTRRNLVAGDAYVRDGSWARMGAMPLASALGGKRLGIIGLGRIGEAIAARAEVSKMEIGYFNRSKKALPYKYFDGPVALADWCDVLLAAMPGGAETRGLVSAEVIEAIGPEGSFINIARGSVVDEPALLAALQSGALGSAGLDVFLNEPAPDPGFAALPNVVLLPHVGSATVETRAAMSQLVLDNLAAHFAGAPLLTPVD